MNNPALWSSIGFWVLVGGLVGDVLVIGLVPSGKFEKVLAVLCTLVVIAGVAIEHVSDAERFGDRRLTPAQQRSIQDALSAHPGYVVIVVSRLGDTEGKIYGNDFIDAFGAAHWKAQWDIDWLRDTEIVSIATVSGVKTPEVALLDTALTAARIPHEFTSIESPETHAIGGAGFQSGIIYLLIGRHKP